MKEWIEVALLSLGAGVAMPIGALLANVERIRPLWLENELRHGIIAFGGGALLSAVALVLVPEGVRELPLAATVLFFGLGGLVFMALDIALARARGSAAQLIAMLADFLPEALALGASFAHDRRTGLLLAGLIAVQNVPESFNAFRELKLAGGLSSRQVILAFAALALLGPIAALGGLLLLADRPAAVAAIMLLAAGGILYLVFQDIAPQARLERHWGPPLGAVAGFLVGIVGHALCGAG